MNAELTARLEGLREAFSLSTRDISTDTLISVADEVADCEDPEALLLGYAKQLQGHPAAAQVLVHAILLAFAMEIANRI